MGNNEHFLRNIPVFAGLDNEVLKQLANLGFKKQYYKDSVVLFENQNDSALFVIISGSLRLSRMSKDGTDVKLTLLKQSDCWGDTSILDGTTPSVNITAEEDSELFIIRRIDLIKLLEDKPQISFAIINQLTKLLHSANLKIKTLSLKSAEGKVASVILQLINSQGKAFNGAIEIDKLPLQQEMADMAGTSRETISRTLNTFVKKGLIELNGSKIRILNFEKIKDQFQQ